MIWWDKCCPVRYSNQTQVTLTVSYNSSYEDIKLNIYLKKKSKKPPKNSYLLYDDKRSMAFEAQWMYEE